MNRLVVCLFVVFVCQGHHLSSTRKKEREPTCFALNASKWMKEKQAIRPLVGCGSLLLIYYNVSVVIVVLHPDLIPMDVLFVLTIMSPAS